MTVLEEPVLQDLPATWLWRAQALAALQRWSEAIPLYAKLAAQNTSPFRSTALFGQAEALRAMGCTLAQGYFMGEPAAAESVESLFAQPGQSRAEAAPGAG